MTAQLEAYEFNEEFMPEWSQLADLLPLDRVSRAVDAWVNSSIWLDALDRLLEKSFAFEAGLADWIHCAKRQQQIKQELDPLQDRD